MIPFLEQAQQYALYHQNKLTRYTHFIGIPLVILSVMIALGLVRIVIPGVVNISLAGIATLILMIYYFRLQWRLALIILPAIIILLWFSSLFSYQGPSKLAFWGFIISFIAGWSLQIAGHVIENRRPAFFDNPWQLIIAPLAIVAELLFLLGYFRELKTQLRPQESAIH